MNIRIIKNVLDCIGFVTTAICISAVPYMCKWLFGLYVIYLISIWMSDEDHK